ncbi:penicillin-insensitive murein endopeptidase [Geminicoccaceae bacterium SYSU G07066]|uniref:Penicillin-insensitive murein endopeptidase n=1 Tax=Benzoatithermus flavus TaxID=3108223 RepID=A0ABU8XUH9_9PROT
MSSRARILFASLCVLCFGLGPAVAAMPDSPFAKELFGSVTVPAPAEHGAHVIGSFAKGCLAGAVALPVDGPGWQAVRLSRNRVWGHPALIAFIGRLAAAAREDGWPGLLVGDMAQPRGGPMRTGHASHQIGLDVDIWLTPMPDRRLTLEERESLAPVSMIADGKLTADPAKLTQARIALLRRAALDPAVARIFVHPGIKQALCRKAGPDRAWLAKIRPWWGHDTHFHVRLACPADEPFCRDQDPPPAGDGCGAELAWWFTDEPWQKPPAPAKPLVLADLPAECAAVLQAP